MEYLGFVISWDLGDEYDKGDTVDDVYEIDGRKYVLLTVTEKYVEYDFHKHGKIYANDKEYCDALESLMFHYKVECGDYSMAGYSWETTYSGCNRKKALASYKEAKRWMGMAHINISVLGRENNIQPTWDENEIIDFDFDDLSFDGKVVEWDIP